MPKEEKRDHNDPTLLVAVDFSYCSRLALRKAKSLLGQRQGRIHTPNDKPLRIECPFHGTTEY